MEENNKKMSYEELEQLVSQLGEQNNMLMAELRNRNAAMMLKRLDYLFQVLDKESVFEYDFVEACAQEIKEALAKPKETKSESKDTEENAEA